MLYADEYGGACYEVHFLDYISLEMEINYILQNHQNVYINILLEKAHGSFQKLSSSINVNSHKVLLRLRDFCERKSVGKLNMNSSSMSKMFSNFLLNVHNHARIICHE